MAAKRRKKKSKPSRRGKRVQPVIGIDLGGTNVRVALIGSEGEVLSARQHALPVDKTPPNVINLMLEIIGELRTRNGKKISVRGIGIGAPGGVDAENGIVTQSPHLPLWQNVPLRDDLAKSMRLPVFLDNDANCFALGEWKFGAGKGLQQMLGMTLGTGIGGGIVIDGKIWHGETGMAGEIGHTVVALDGPLCACGGRGCLETFSSGTALAQHVQKALAEGKRSTLHHVVELNGVTIEEAARANDSVAQEAFSELGRALGYGIANWVNLTGISHVLLGGKVTRSWDFFFPAMRDILQRQCFKEVARNLKIFRGTLNDQAGILGAGALVAVS